MTDCGVNVDPYPVYPSLFSDATKKALVRFIYLGFNLQSGCYRVQVEAQPVCQGQDRGAKRASGGTYRPLWAGCPNIGPNQL